MAKAKKPKIDTPEALALHLAEVLSDAGYALFDAGLYGVGTVYDKTQIALDNPLLKQLRAASGAK